MVVACSEMKEDLDITDSWAEEESVNHLMSQMIHFSPHPPTFQIDLGLQRFICKFVPGFGVAEGQASLHVNYQNLDISSTVDLIYTSHLRIGESNVVGKNSDRCFKSAPDQVVEDFIRKGSRRSLSCCMVASGVIARNIHLQKLKRTSVDTKYIDAAEGVLSCLMEAGDYCRIAENAFIIGNANVYKCIGKLSLQLPVLGITMAIARLLCYLSRILALVTASKLNMQRLVTILFLFNFTVERVKKVGFLDT